MLFPYKKPARKCDLDHGGTSVFEYELPHCKIFPVGNFLDLSHKSFKVKVVVSEWTEELVTEMRALMPEGVDELSELIDQALEKYHQNISPETVMDRLEDWAVPKHMVDETSNPCTEMIRMAFAQHGIRPFLKLRELYVAPERDLYIFDFDCLLDSYLHENGFGVMVSEGKVDFIIRNLVENFAFSGN
ncbi:hypothetical protein [Persicirhabdus sediminis]|uniref:Uncharacterized protein n=1 Tax=Persicirhabdus sediminis TaxID=454144 RepID=A0A8J7ME46_9BACT|nr:hypothetical protein [Persicirhabdus sediminis]MBK1791041.1 hypothetical protein [Persicirhabdus sediminis]